MKPEHVANFLSKKEFSFLPKQSPIRLIGTGAYNTTFAIGESYVFRANTHQDAVGGHGLRSEHEILNILPEEIAPKPLFLDDSCSEFTVPYRIESLARGETVKEYTREILLILAQHLSKIHSITFEQSGEYPGVSDKYSIGATLKLFMDEMGDTEMFRSLTQKARRYIAYHDKVNPLKKFSLIHYDLNSDNMLYDGKNLTIVDWEFAEIGDPAVDICTLFWFSYLFGYTPKIPDEDKTFFLREYIAAGGDVSIKERFRMQEPLVVLLQSLWFAAQIKNKDLIPEHILTNERLKTYERGLRIGLEYLESNNFQIV